MIITKDISNKIVVVGVDPNGQGGISTVISRQRQMMETFHFVKVAAAGWRKYFLPVTALFKSLSYISSKYKIAHVHAASGSDFYRSAVFILLFSLMGKSVVLHMHGAMFEEFFRYHPGFVKFVVSRCASVITVSRYFVNFFLQSGLHDKVSLLHNTIEPHRAMNNRNDNGRIIFSYFGALDNRKGIFECIDAIGRHPDSFRGKAEFHLGGNGDTARLQMMIERYGIYDIVKFRGWLDEEDKHRLLSSTDVFVHPSRFESFGISILEAMDYGLPVVTSNVGGIPDLVTDGENGLIVTPGDCGEIYQAMIKLMDSPDLRRQLGAESARRAREFYPDKIATSLKSIYQDLLDK